MSWGETAPTGRAKGTDYQYYRMRRVSCGGPGARVRKDQGKRQG